MKAFSVTWLNQVTVYTGDINYKAYLLRKQLPACRRLLFPLLHVEKAGLWKRDVVPFPRATKEIGDVCTQATKADKVFFFFCSLSILVPSFLLITWSWLQMKLSQPSP